MWFITVYLLSLLFTHSVLPLESNSEVYCRLCRKESKYSSCYQNGIYSQLALPSINGSIISDVSVIISLLKEENKICNVTVVNSVGQADTDWHLDPFYIFDNIKSPSKFILRSHGLLPPEGTYSILLADNQSLSFDIFYPLSYTQKDSILELNTSENTIPVPKNIQRCLIRSNKSVSDPDFIHTICTDFESRPCFQNEVNVSFSDASLDFMNVTFNNSLITPLNLTIKCLLDSKVPMKGQDFYSSMKISYNPQNKFAKMGSLRLSGYEFDVSILVISMFVVFFWINAMILLFRRRRPNGIIDLRKKQCRINFFSSKTSKLDKTISNLKTFPGWAKDRYFDIARVEFGQELGRGQFGVVKRGKLFDGPHKKWDVAMKESYEDRDEDLLAEGKIMSIVGYHDHIVNLQCVSWNMRGNFYLILEYCHNGCILDLLRKERDKFLQGRTKGLYTLETLLIWAKQISSGMEFLDSKNVIHGDLAGRNILLSMEYSAKISDFGLAHNLYQDLNWKKLQKTRLPIIWMGPETFEMGTITKKSDVWAFGILLWEIFTLGKQPYEGFSDEAVKAIIFNGKCTLERPQVCPDSLWTILQTCWSSMPDCRPSFTTFKANIELLIDKESSRMKEIDDGIKSMQKRFFDNPGYMAMYI